MRKERKKSLEPCVHLMFEEESEPYSAGFLPSSRVAGTPGRVALRSLRILILQNNFWVPSQMMIIASNFFINVCWLQIGVLWTKNLGAGSCFLSSLFWTRNNFESPCISTPQKQGFLDVFLQKQFTLHGKGHLKGFFFPLSTKFFVKKIPEGCFCSC